MSNAKSGSFFFYSDDGKYVIKTVSTADAKHLERTLPSYCSHVSSSSRDSPSLIAPFVGLYTVRMWWLKRSVLFVVMGSVFDTDGEVEKVFDLKGSVVGRMKGEGEEVGKDGDFRRMVEEWGGGIWMRRAGGREEMGTSLARDLAWLKSENVMDYSMLVGVGKRGEGEEEGGWEIEAGGGGEGGGEEEQEAGRGEEVMFVGIIDVLQTFTARKKLEALGKGAANGGREGVSCTNPEHYARRFLKFWEMWCKQG